MSKSRDPATRYECQEQKRKKTGKKGKKKQEGVRKKIRMDDYFLSKGKEREGRAKKKGEKKESPFLNTGKEKKKTRKPENKKKRKKKDEKRNKERTKKKEKRDRELPEQVNISGRLFFIDGSTRGSFNNSFMISNDGKVNFDEISS